MNSQKVISVCVPCYDRPDMLKQLISSFLKQKYKKKELIISDDSPGDSLKKVVESVGNADIKYFKNAQNLGYCKNFLKSMERAEGDYIVMLGDDDVFQSPDSLGRYVQVFDKYPKVSYVYSNLVQFSNKLKIEYLADIFSEDRLFERGEDAMKGIWTTSIFIPGLAVRNNVDLKKLYPTDDMLFPQLQLVGHIINQSSGYGIADFLIAGRAHPEQLGFYAIKGERIKGAEKHGTVELFTIFDRLANQYKFTFSSNFLARNLVDRFFIMMLKEKTIVGRQRVKQNYEAFCKASPFAKKSNKLKFSFVIAMVMPSWIINFIRVTTLKLIRFKQRQLFQNEEEKLRRMVGNVE